MTFLTLNLKGKHGELKIGGHTRIAPGGAETSPGSSLNGSGGKVAVTANGYLGGYTIFQNQTSNLYPMKTERSETRNV